MYTWDTRILYSRLGPDNCLSPIGLLDLFQDLTTLHSEDRGCGRDWVIAQGCGWLISRWRVQLGDLPRCGAPVRATTWAYQQRKALCRRAFSLEDRQGNRLALADSLWTLVDLKTGAPTDAARISAPLMTDQTPPSLTGLPKKVRLPDELTAAPPFPVTWDLLDANGHVNNVRSVALAMRALPPEAKLDAMAVDYHLPLLPGQQVQLASAPVDQGVAAVLRAGGQDCVSAQFWIK